MRLKTILLGIAVVAVSFFVSLKAMDWLSPRGTVGAPVLVELPPLPPAPRSSSIIAPVAITLAAIRDAADRGAPRTFAGKADNPVSQILQNADIGWTASRGPITATGAQDVLSLATPLTGTLNVTGSLSSKATGAVGDALGSLLGGNVAKQIGSVNIKSLNANAEIKGNVTITARPKLAAAWRIEPNLAAQVTLGDTNLSVAGARVNVPAQVKPLIDKTVADQLTAVQARIRNDPAFENSARLQWAKACRSIPAARHRHGLVVAGALAGTAADPRDRGTAAHRCIGGDADARHRGGDPHHPGADQARLPVSRDHRHRPADPGRVSIGVPIDMPFTDINKIVEAQFAGRTFPGGRFGLGRRHRQARQRRGIGRPAADLASGQRQGEKEFLRIRRRGHCAYLGQAGARPGAADPAADRHRTRRRIGGGVRAARGRGARGRAASAKGAGGQGHHRPQAVRLECAEEDRRRDRGFQKNEDGVRVAAEITSLRLADIAFDSKTLRVIAEAAGAINVYITALPGL